MKRTASLSLDWEKDGNDAYIAQLPPVPGYPGTWYAGIDNLTSMLDGGWYLTIFNRPEPSIFVCDLPGMVMHAKTAEELMNIMEEQFTPEMIADELQAKGITPDELTASRHASRKATRRVASLDLDWKRCPYDFAEYEAQLPEIPGYPGTGDGNALAYIAPKDREYIFWLTIAVTYDDVVTLTNKDFGISSSDSSVDMEQAVESLSVEEIADAAAAKGLEPVEED